MTASGRPARPVPTLPSSKRSSGTVCRPRPGTACPSPHLVEVPQGPPSAGVALRRSPQEPRGLVAVVRPGPGRRPALSLTGPHHRPLPVPTPAAPMGPPGRPGHRNAHRAASRSGASWALPELEAGPRSSPQELPHAAPGRRLPLVASPRILGHLAMPYALPAQGLLRFYTLVLLCPSYARLCPMPVYARPFTYE